MAGITLAIAEAKLTTWLDAEEKIASGQEVRRGDRVLKYADLKFVREQIEYWNGKVSDLERGDGSGDIIPRSIVPIDDI